MNILLNGENLPIDENTTAAALVEQMGLSGQRLALEVNRCILPRTEFEDYVFKPNDRVELVQAIGGG
jgi:sulfur carrier protein